MHPPGLKCWLKKKGIDIADIDGFRPGGDWSLKKMYWIMCLIQYQKQLQRHWQEKFAELENINIQGIQGSGVRNKVLAEDVRLSASVSQVPVQMAQPLDEELIPIKGMRKIVAERIETKSWLKWAQANHRITVDMTNSVALREQYKAVGRKGQLQRHCASLRS